MKTIYTLPMAGEVTNWESFSGEKGYVGPVEFAVAARPEWMEVYCHLLTIDIDAGTAQVEVNAEPAFHTAFGQFLAGKSPDDVAAFYGYDVLRRGNNPRPLHELRYNHSRG